MFGRLYAPVGIRAHRRVLPNEMAMRDALMSFVIPTIPMGCRLSRDESITNSSGSKYLNRIQSNFQNWSLIEEMPNHWPTLCFSVVGFHNVTASTNHGHTSPPNSQLSLLAPPTLPLNPSPSPCPNPHFQHNMRSFCMSELQQLGFAVATWAESSPQQDRLSRRGLKLASLAPSENAQSTSPFPIPKHSHKRVTSTSRCRYTIG